MTSALFQLLIPVAVGAAVAVQAQVMGQIDRASGTLESMFVTYAGGGLLITIVMLARRGGNASALIGLPWYTFLAGLFGLIIVGGISFSVPRLGLVATFTTIVSFQFVVGSLIDHYGWIGATVRTMTVSRIAGIGMLLGGVWLIVR
jgi:transporter family-2 protein